MIRWHRHSRASRRLRAQAELLEARHLLSGQVTFVGAGQIASFAGVGFALNPVATLYGSYNGQPDNSVGDYQVQIDWGDGDGFSSKGVELASLGGGGAILVKATHIYQTQNTYPVTIDVTGPGGSSAEGQATSVVVTPMPDAASRPPDVPTSYNGAQPLGSVSLSVIGAGQIASFAGVGFALNPVATVYGSYDGQSDNSVGDYQAQINWGDSPQWSTDAGLVSAGGGGAVLIKGSHIYQQQGTYDVTVYVTGPDGQTVSSDVTSVVVTPMPDAASRPPDVPTSYNGAQPLGSVSLSVIGAGQIASFAGVGFALNPVATVYGSYDGQSDNSVGDYQAQINWGDSPQWSTDAGLVSAGGGGAVLIKGSHIYQQQGTYDVTVYVTGPDGQTVSSDVTSVVVTPMPDAASRPPDVPILDKGAKPLGTVSLSIVGAGQINALTGQQIPSATVATLYGSYDGQADNTQGDYQVQINWGDSPHWVAGQLLSSPGGYSVAAFGSYTYSQVGSYDVTIYVTGPDGQSASATTTEVVVAQDPTPTNPTPTNPTPTNPTPTNPTPTNPTPTNPTPTNPTNPTPTNPISIQVSIQQINQIVPPPVAPTPPSSHASAKAKQAYAKKLATYQKVLAAYNRLVGGLVDFLNSPEATETDQINTKNRQAAFIGQAAVESWYFTRLTEGHAFGSVGTGTEIGRGYLQITGQANYKAAAKFLNQSLPETLRLLATDPPTAASVSGWYWSGGSGVPNINYYADIWDITSVSGLVNAGRIVPPAAIHNLQQRLDYSDQALNVLSQ